MAIAAAEVPSVAMVMRVSKRRTNSSSTKIEPAIGALKAVARPAPAPAASRMRASVGVAAKEVADEVGDARAHLHRRSFAAQGEAGADGEEAADELHDERGGALSAERSPWSTASTWGMPLPDASGEKRRTSQAASAVAAAARATTIARPRRL